MTFLNKNPAEYRQEIKSLKARINELLGELSDANNQIVQKDSRVSTLKSEIERVQVIEKERANGEINQYKILRDNDIKRVRLEEHERAESQIADIKSAYALKDLELQKERSALEQERLQCHDLREGIFKQADSLNNIMEEVFKEASGIISENKLLETQARKAREQAEKTFQAIGGCADRSLFIIKNIPLEDTTNG